MTQCWVNVGPPSTTLAQHWPSIGSSSRAYWVHNLLCSYLNDLFQICVEKCPDKNWGFVPLTSKTTDMICDYKYELEQVCYFQLIIYIIISISSECPHSTRHPHSTHPPHPHFFFTFHISSPFCSPFTFHVSFHILRYLFSIFFNVGVPVYIHIQVNTNILKTWKRSTTSSYTGISKLKESLLGGTKQHMFSSRNI